LLGSLLRPESLAHTSFITKEREDIPTHLPRFDTPNAGVYAHMNFNLRAVNERSDDRGSSPVLPPLTWRSELMADRKRETTKLLGARAIPRVRLRRIYHIITTPISIILKQRPTYDVLLTSQATHA
jgi:hypothetical protein